MTEQEMTQDIKNYIERLEKENQELSDKISYLVFNNEQSKIKKLKNKLNCFNFFSKIKTFFSIKTP